ncbi:MAG: hypothetical protein EAZ99_17375, partial [Alphaproteobacteria bacterium]
FEEGLRITQRLAAADPSSATLQRDLWVVMWKLRGLPGSSITWASIVQVMEAMDRRGTLLPADRRFLEEARGNASAADGRGGTLRGVQHQSRRSPAREVAGQPDRAHVPVTVAGGAPVRAHPHLRPHGTQTAQGEPEAGGSSWLDGFLSSKKAATACQHRGAVAFTAPG